MAGNLTLDGVIHFIFLGTNFFWFSHIVVEKRKEEDSR